MDDLDDFGLIDLACEGSARAFEILVRRHYDTMYKFAFRWCGNRSDAEDVTQEACIKLARALGSFEKKSAFSSWLYRLVINTAKDWHRGQARHHVPTGPGATVGEPEPQVASTAGNRKRHISPGRFWRGLEHCPRRERAAVILVLGEGLSHRQAAGVLDCAESTVSWRIHEARRKLKRMFEAERRHG